MPQISSKIKRQERLKRERERAEGKYEFPACIVTVETKNALSSCPLKGKQEYGTERNHNFFEVWPCAVKE